MRKLTVSMATLAVCVMPAVAQTYDNGGMDPQPGGCSGGEYSQIEAPGTLHGNNTMVTAFHQADDFVVPQGENWDICELTWYLYQTSSPTNEPIVEAFIQVWDGSPAGGGSIIAGDMTTNRIISSTFTNIYRVSTDTSSCLRAIKEVKIDMTWLGALGPGQYYIEIGSTGNPGFPGPWANHKVPRDVGTDNSEFFSVGTGLWTVNSDPTSGEPWDYPFKLDYNCGGFTLAVDMPNGCPGPITVSWAGSPGNGQQALVVGNSQGSTTIPQNQPCPGTILGIQGQVQLVDPPGFFSNQGGAGSISGQVRNAGVCGKWLQLVKGGTCETSNVAQIQ